MDPMLLHPHAAKPLLARLCHGSPSPRCSTVRCSILDELKYQLSNADEESRPARDLVENPIAFAYLIVLFALAAGLAYLALEDRRIAARQEQSLREMEEAASMLREQGRAKEAAILDQDLRAQRAPPKPDPSKPKGLAADPYGPADGNRFQRRNARDERRKKRKKRSKNN